MSEKADYVRSATQTRDHHCHWPGCKTQVPPASWGCKTHWFLLPQEIRNAIWRALVSGQEVNATPTRGYLAAAQQAQDWIHKTFRPANARPEYTPAKWERLKQFVAERDAKRAGDRQLELELPATPTTLHLVKP